DYQQVQRGAFYLYRDERELELGMAKMELLRAHGLEMEIVTPEDLASIDPAFAPAKGVLAGAIHSKSDASGNCELFTKILADKCRNLGVEFRLGTTARRF